MWFRTIIGEKENVKLITENIIETISELRNQEGKNIWIVGGGKLTSMLLAVDLIDEIRITYIPVILGNGIPLFPDHPKESKWELRGCGSYKNGVVQIPWYQGDHRMFLQNGCPAIAVSLHWLIENFEIQELTHTSKDNLSIVNYERVAECALGIAKLIHKL